MRAAARVVRVFNSLTGTKQALRPLNPPELTWYMCGPTVYDHTHLGHARTFVSFDVVRRVLERVHHQPVRQVWGMTDVDDKIINRARERGMEVKALATEFEAAFWADMAAMGVLPPHASTRVSEHIGEIVDFVRVIVDNGLAYVGEETGSVYFDTARYGTPPLGRFRRAPPPPPPPVASAPAAPAGEGDVVPEAARGEGNGGNEGNGADEVEGEGDGGEWARGARGEKRSRADFALWKRGAAGDNHGGAEWDSPWGRGRPGWHIECSAMATSHFGPHLDVHSGGVDLQFPHHENEIAQCDAHRSPHRADHSGWGSYWLHAGHLHIEGRKMSKSLKNFVTVGEFLAEHTAAQFRVFCLLNHYRTHTTFAAARMREAQAHLDRARLLGDLVRPAGQLHRGGPVKWGACERELAHLVADTEQAVVAALADDFDTREAMMRLHQLAGDAVTYVQRADNTPCPLLASNAAGLVSGMLATFGLPHDGGRSSTLASAAGADGSGGTAAGEQGEGAAGARELEERWVDALVGLRAQVRGLAKDKGMADKELRGALFKLCDVARDEAAQRGVAIHDSARGGAAWSRTTPNKP